MRKLPDWLHQEQATLEASKSHHYLQMNLQTLRHFLGKMNHTTPAFKAKTSSWMRLVSFLILAILITTAHHPIQLWLIGILLLMHIAMLPGEVLLHLFKVLFKVLLISTIVILPSILFQGFQNGGLFLLRAGIIVLNISLFLATTTSIQLVEALRQLHVPKTFVQTIDITLKYSYILGKHLHQQIECVQLRTVGQRGLRGHVAERLRYGYKAQRSLPLEEGRRLFPIGIGGSHDLHDLTWLERKAYDSHSRWELPLHRGDWNP